MDLVMFLITTAAQLSGFTYAEDREYFSRPVAVRWLYSDLSTKYAMCVHENGPRQGRPFPADRRSLVTRAQLTKGQRKAMGLPSKRTEAARAARLAVSA